MLRFFRQIRQRLLTDNKFSKYLLYAVGEILLVVIGILIALQVDNWNEERKFKSTQREFLEDLKTQVTNDISVRSSDINWFSSLNDQTERALILLRDRELLTDSSEYQTVSETLGNASILMPRTTSIVYSESTMDKIDPELNLRLIEYIQQSDHSYNVFQKLSTSLQAMADNRINPYVDFNSSVSTLVRRPVHYDFRSIKTNRAVINVLHSSVIYRRGLISDVESQIDQAHEIIDFIDSLLNQKSR
ncbi:MAG: DUF6090 family protein [Robiginitalea sp.]|jgi:hypothetical protein